MKRLAESTNELKTKEILENLFSQMKNSNFTFDENFEFGNSANENDDYTYIAFHGGLNGNGKWSDYFSDLSIIFSELEKIYDSVWLISTNIDVLDDVFDVSMGVR